jgi:hypothetical protein
MGETDSTERDSFRKNATQMTQIPATILAVEKQPGKHRVLVRILLRKYRGSFNTLKFGEDKPVLGSLSARTTGSYLLPRSRSKSGKFVPALDDRVTSVIFRKHRCAFGGLSFGEKKPYLASYRNGWLDLVYHQNPGLKAGRSFPLWTIQ